MPTRDPHLLAVRILEDAGGELVGRTRLQKTAYLSQLAGFGDDFEFEYRHYGPFSEDLARGMEIAAAFGRVDEQERASDWGGRYSVYRLHDQVQPSSQARAAFIDKVKRIGAIELELAATAAFLFAVEGIGRTNDRNPWQETQNRKPDKARGGRLSRAAAAYETLRRLKTPKPLPELQSPQSLMESSLQ